LSTQSLLVDVHDLKNVESVLSADLYHPNSEPRCSPSFTTTCTQVKNDLPNHRKTLLIVVYWIWTTTRDFAKTALRNAWSLSWSYAARSGRVAQRQEQSFEPWLFLLFFDFVSVNFGQDNFFWCIPLTKTHRTTSNGNVCPFRRW